MDVPDVSYARSGDVAIAYQTVGDGSEDVVFVRGFAGDLLSVWEQPLLVRFIQELASFARVTMIDKRGTGLSDRVRDVPTLETRMDDLRAVMDAIGAEQAVLWTAQEGARLAVLFAASYPERTAGLVLFDPTAKGRLTADYPWEPDDAEWRNRLAQIREGWGQTDFLEDLLAEWSPGQREDPEFRAWFISHMRRGLSPGSAVAFFRMMRDSDVSDVLPVVRVPTVVLSSEAQRGPAQYVAERIPGARLVELPSSLRSIYHWVDDEANMAAVSETKQLLSEIRTPPTRDRVLTTVFFTDIVGSTDRERSSGTGLGAICSNAITLSCDIVWPSSGVTSSIRQGTGSSPLSTAPAGRSSAHAPLPPTSAPLELRCGWASIRASASALGTRSRGWR